MNKNIQHTNANNGISLAGVRALVAGLPLLEYISFGSIGRVLDSSGFEDSAPLKLTYFSEQESTYYIQKVCAGAHAARVRLKCSSTRSLLYKGRTTHPHGKLLFAMRPMPHPSSNQRGLSLLQLEGDVEVAKRFSVCNCPSAHINLSPGSLSRRRPAIVPPLPEHFRSFPIGSLQH